MIHHVYANRSNIGDWLSAIGIQRLLREYPLTQHLCDDPFVPDTLRRLASAGADDLVVIGGGGLFMDYFEPFWRGLLSIADRVPFGIWGVGYCDLKQEHSRPPQALLEEVIARSAFTVVRDEHTRRNLGGHGVAAPVPCPSVAAVSAPEAPGWGVLHVDNYTTVGPEAYEIMEAGAEAFAANTGRPLRRTNNRIPAHQSQALDELLARYAASDIVLSSALHGCIIAVAMGRKVLAVSGDHKIDAFMDAAGLGEWVLNWDEARLVPERLHAIGAQPDVSAFRAQAVAANVAVAARIEILLRPPVPSPLL